MNTPPLDSQVRACHDCFCGFVAWKMPLGFAVRHQWERWLAEGFTIEQLQLVLKRWSIKIAQGTDAGVMRLSRITDPITFSEDYSIAKAEQKIRQDPRERALEQLRPTACEQRNGAPPKHSGEAILNLTEQMRKAAGGN